MAGISGTLKVGEASATVAAISARRHGSSGSYLAIQLGLIGVGLVMGLLASVVFGERISPVVGGCSGIVIGWIVLLTVRRPFSVAR